jgi:cellulose synthase/poly-beta-1,6-N-acetylglucosamine synthase-like glycosyltransferase
MATSLTFLKRKKEKEMEIVSNKGFSLLIPCYNEESILETAINGIKRLNYKDIEILYINDGSKDNTLKMLNDFLILEKCERKPNGYLESERVNDFYQSSIYHNVYVIDKVNGGKADSLNAGTNYASKEYIITLDADSVLDDSALGIVNGHLQKNNVVAAGGTVQILQGRDFQNLISKPSLSLKHIIRFQIFEYLRGFYVYKLSLAKLNALAIISGAFGIFNKEVLNQVGGYRKTIGEDIDITLRFQEYVLNNPDKKIVYIPEAICYTECPENWLDLFKQRVRWQKAFMDCVIKFRGLFFKTFLSRSLSFFVVIDSLFVGIFSTYMSFLSLIVVALKPSIQSKEILLTYAIITLICNLTYTIVALIIAKSYGLSFKKSEMLKIINTLLMDLFIFRFISVFFILYGSIAYFFNKHDWNKVARTGRNYQIKPIIENIDVLKNTHTNNL